MTEPDRIGLAAAREGLEAIKGTTTASAIAAISAHVTAIATVELASAAQLSALLELRAVDDADLARNDPRLITLGERLLVEGRIRTLLGLSAEVHTEGNPST